MRVAGDTLCPFRKKKADVLPTVIAGAHYITGLVFIEVNLNDQQSGTIGLI